MTIHEVVGCNFIPYYIIENEIELLTAELDGAAGGVSAQRDGEQGEKTVRKQSLEETKKHIDGKSSDFSPEKPALSDRSQRVPSQEPAANSTSISSTVHRIFDNFNPPSAPILLMSSSGELSADEQTSRLQKTQSKSFQKYEGSELILKVSPDSIEDIETGFKLVKEIKECFLKFNLLQGLDINIDVLCRSLNLCQWKWSTERIELGYSNHIKKFITSRDLLMHEVGHAVVSEIGKEKQCDPGTFMAASRRERPDQGEANAIAEHVADVLTVIAKHSLDTKEEKYLENYEEDEHWLIGKGMVSTNERFAYRNMKNPGTAYYEYPESRYPENKLQAIFSPTDMTQAKAGPIDEQMNLTDANGKPETKRDQVLAKKKMCRNLLMGNDPQPSHMKDFVTLPMTIDNKGAHIFCGIPNRAFYLFCQSLKQFAYQDPGKIWIQAIKISEKQETFSSFAEKTVATAIAYGKINDNQQDTYRRAILYAWESVGINLAQNEEDYARLVEIAHQSIATGVSSPVAQTVATPIDPTAAGAFLLKMLTPQTPELIQQPDLSIIESSEPGLDAFSFLSQNVTISSDPLASERSAEQSHLSIVVPPELSNNQSCDSKTKRQGNGKTHLFKPRIYLPLSPVSLSPVSPLSGWLVKRKSPVLWNALHVYSPTVCGCLPIVPIAYKVRTYLHTFSSQLPTWYTVPMQYPKWKK